LLLLHLCGPEAKRRPNSQLYSAAQSRDQAALLFALAAKIVRMSPALLAVVGIREAAKQLYCESLGTLYRALSADASTAFGLSPAFIVHDELGQVKGPRSQLYEALETATGAHDEPLSIVISTQAPTDGDLLSMLIDDAIESHDPRTKLFMYSAPEDCNPFTKAAIRKANPAFGDFLNAREVMDQCHAAERMPSREAAYRNLILNQRVNQETPFIPRKVWLSNQGEPLEAAFAGVPLRLALDLSARNDLSALAIRAEFEAAHHCRVEFFAPALHVVDRSMRDRVPYDTWADQGHITLTPGASVDYAYIARRLVELTDAYDVEAIFFDRWRIDVLEAELARLDVELPLIPHGQGFKDMSPALDMLEGELLNERMRLGANPVLSMCAANAVVTADEAGNRKLNKKKSTGRIDGMVSLAMTFGSTDLDTEETITGSVVAI
jgi:phage terminase large subunit-like protein